MSIRWTNEAAEVPEKLVDENIYNGAGQALPFFWSSSLPRRQVLLIA